MAAANINDGIHAHGSGPNASTISTTLPSPNRIPPRTSSTNYTYNALAPPARSVLRPVLESDWLAQSTHTHSHSHPHSDTHAHTHRDNPSTSHLTQQHYSDTMTSADFRDPSRYATEDFDYLARKTWSEKKEKVVLAPFNYLLSQPGKDIRSKLISAFNTWLNVPKETLDIISNVVAMLHTASLLIDDVEDNSELRRGLPVAQHLYGVAQTINSANCVYFHALRELSKLNNPMATAIFWEELINLHRGQGMDLYWRDCCICPSEDEYLEMVGNKTGGLFRLGIKLMQAESKVKIDCVPLVNILGIIFQIQDDYRNLMSTEYEGNKGYCEDLTEGKFSFLIIHSIRADPLDQRLSNILRQKTTSHTVKKYAVDYMKSTGSFEYTKKVLEVLIERAKKTADELSSDGQKNNEIYEILDKLTV
ncbi:isoprenoid synthase domain-containing protein [Xylaria bambusicola]|uniref:isoprenoid synthase domain-containing protein n=1 Tax=Xylaria bambusicola TaxID=326684 RepID=UPI0020074873|nr:isoprenoid synthase domain-containing protein [Xylaria bambusicola]KAI0509393.1 isoprenoid synthase domain-containing protein [Xylaria bambusicola]